MKSRTVREKNPAQEGPGGAPGGRLRPSPEHRERGRETPRAGRRRYRAVPAHAAKGRGSSRFCVCLLVFQLCQIKQANPLANSFLFKGSGLCLCQQHKWMRRSRDSKPRRPPSSRNRTGRSVPPSPNSLTTAVRILCT